MTLLSPLAVYTITTALGVSALSYCLVKINELTSNIKNLKSDQDFTKHSVDKNRCLFRDRNDELDGMKSLLKENTKNVEKLSQNISELKTVQALHETHIDKLKELSAKQTEAKKKSS